MLAPEELENLKQKLTKTFGLKILPKKIRAIKVNSSYHWQPPLFIEVGKTCAHLEQGGAGEKIIAIFESTAFLVCTPGHGADGGLPHFFSRQDVRRVFEAE